MIPPSAGFFLPTNLLDSQTMKNNAITETKINGGTNAIALQKNPSLVNNLVSFRGRSTGVISFRTKTLGSDYQVPGSPYSIDLATNKSITFNGEPLEAIELTDAGSGSVDVTIVQSEQ